MKALTVAVILFVVVLALGGLEYYTYETMNSQLSNTRADLSAQIAADNSLVSKLEGNVTSLQSQVSQENSTIHSLESQIQTLEGLVSSLRSQVNGLQAGCGSVITANTTLSANIGLCPGNGLVIGANHTVLDCAGHTISGTGENGTSMGIVISGAIRGVDHDGPRISGVTVMNCRVKGFGFGFYVLSTPFNTLTGNSAYNNTSGFFFELSSSNAVSGNTANSNAGSGFTFVRGIECADGKCSRQGDWSNTLTKNTASNNGGDGFNLTYFYSGKLTGNTADNDAFNGFELIASGFSGLNETTLSGNTANNNKQDGFCLRDLSEDNTLVMNTANSNAYDGFYIEGPSSNNLLSSNNALTGNTADFNSAYGYYDGTTGSGTAGTANFYSGDECSSNSLGGSIPSGLGSPEL